MDEGTSKAIPLRRSRSSTRAVSGRPLRLTEQLSGGVRYALSRPHQLWLAGLGSAAITIRGARAGWSRLVAEGTMVEGWLLRSLGGADPDARG